MTGFSRASSLAIWLRRRVRASFGAMRTTLLIVFPIAAFFAATGPNAALAADNAAAPQAAPTSEGLLRDAQEAARRGDKPAALQLFQSAMIYGATRLEPYLGIAEFHAANDELDLARRHFGTVLEFDPANAAALKGLGLIEIKMGNRTAAEARLALLRRACGPNCPETAQLGQALGGGASN